MAATVMCRSFNAPENDFSTLILLLLNIIGIESENEIIAERIRMKMAHFREIDCFEATDKFIIVKYSLTASNRLSQCTECFHCDLARSYS